MRQHRCPRCGRRAILLPWPFSRRNQRGINEACRPCIDEVWAAVEAIPPC